MTCSKIRNKFTPTPNHIAILIAKRLLTQVHLPPPVHPHHELYRLRLLSTAKLPPSILSPSKIHGAKILKLCSEEPRLFDGRPFSDAQITMEETKSTSQRVLSFFRTIDGLRAWCVALKLELVGVG